jgi:iron complex transport system ATP-binding protein
MINFFQTSYSINKKHLLNPTDLQIDPNEFLVIMGANGAGKSTLLKLMAGLLKPSKGKILFDNIDLTKYTVAQLAQKRAVLSQHYQYSFPLTAKEIAMMGRYPFYDSSPTLEDEKIVSNAMELMRVTKFANRSYESLSGGEAQKVQMSRVLAQMFTEKKEQKYLLLDEPVSHLDIKFQHQLLVIAKSLVNPQTAVVAVLHDINLALKYADRIIFMKEGCIIYEHKIMEDLPLNIINEVFGVEAQLVSIPNQQRKLVVF